MDQDIETLLEEKLIQNIDISKDRELFDKIVTLSIWAVEYDVFCGTSRALGADGLETAVTNSDRKNVRAIQDTLKDAETGRVAEEWSESVVDYYKEKKFDGMADHIKNISKHENFRTEHGTVLAAGISSLFKKLKKLFNGNKKEADRTTRQIIEGGVMQSGVDNIKKPDEDIVCDD